MCVLGLLWKDTTLDILDTFDKSSKFYSYNLTL